MRRSVALVAVFLVYLMMPGSLELTESLAHLVVHGDTAHGDPEGRDGHDSGDGADEHGCSGGYHLCVCHQSTGFVLPFGVVIANTIAPAANDVPEIAEAAPSGQPGRIFRPPIA
jgi:hypothetical protein